MSKESALPHAMDADIQVGMGESKSVQGAQTIGTYGLGPCVGIALFDPQNEIGHMAHTMGHDTVALENAVALLGLDNINDAVNVWLSGGWITREESRASNNVRIRVLDFLTDVGLQDNIVDITWVDETGESAQICLNGFGLYEVQLFRHD